MEWLIFWLFGLGLDHRSRQVRQILRWHRPCRFGGMSKIALPAVYHSETFSSSYGKRPFRPETPQGQDKGSEDQGTPRPVATPVAPARQPDFLVQLMQNIDPALRKTLGRRDIAERREAAYGAAEANRPSRQVLPARLFRIVA